MARTSKTQTATSKAPDLIAFHVQTKGEKDFWSRIGASWQHQDGKGMTLQLDTLPMSGKIVLRQPLPAGETGARA